MIMTDKEVFVSFKNKCCNIMINNTIHAADFKSLVKNKYVDDVYFVCNGKRLSDSDVISEGIIHVVPRLLGGKGGFGSMLRAIGAQIEKTTNREACRDLSGRRLRDINEEKRLKNWISQQAERESEMAERRQKRLERLCTVPKHQFEDKEYEEQRSNLLERVNDSVEEGLKIATSSNNVAGPSSKRKSSETVTSKGKSKKPKLWIDADEEDLSSSLSSDEDDDSITNKEKLQMKTSQIAI